MKRLTHALIAQAALCAALCALCIAGADAQTVKVNWSDLSAGSTQPRLFGSNDSFCGQFAEGALDPKYAARMASINVKFLRLHSSIVQNWTTNGAWDQSKIATELNAPYVKACGGRNILITINEPPKWCRNADGSVNDTRYADFCAQLVQIVNKKLHKGVKYWECLNEPDLSNDFHNNWPPLFTLYNLCVKAMKAVDGHIKVGGPVCSWYQQGLVDQFLTQCWANVDFLSWHKYMTCDNGTDIYHVAMLHTADFVKEVDSARSAIADHRTHGYADGHKIECAIDEFNIPCDWRNQGWGQKTNVGATFFASVLTHLASAHLDIATNWSSKDDVYGFIDMDDTVRPPGYLYLWANNDLVGKIAASSSDNPDCEVLPILRGPRDTGDKHVFLLINKSATPNDITLEHGLSIDQPVRVSLIDAAGLHPSMARHIHTANPAFAMPGYSVALITMP